MKLGTEWTPVSFNNSGLNQCCLICIDAVWDTTDTETVSALSETSFRHSWCHTAVYQAQLIQHTKHLITADDALSRKQHWHCLRHRYCCSNDVWDVLLQHHLHPRTPLVLGTASVVSRALLIPVYFFLSAQTYCDPKKLIMTPDLAFINILVRGKRLVQNSYFCEWT